MSTDYASATVPSAEPTSANATRPLRALFIGMAELPGQDPVPAARHDVIAWWDLATTHLGLTPDAIEVLAVPPLLPEELAGPRRHDDTDTSFATRLAAARATPSAAATPEALAEALVRLQTGERGLLTWSGHGEAPRTPFLQLPLSEDGPSNCRLTLVFDTCTGWPAGLSPSAENLLQSLIARGACALLASAPEAVAHALPIAGTPRGAFTWALQTALTRWSTDPLFSASRAPLSALLARARLLLDGLGLDQVPRLLGADRAFSAPVGFPLSPNPDGPTQTLQFGPISLLDRWQIKYVRVINGVETEYTLALIAVLTTAVTAGGIQYGTGTEYWRLDTSAINTMQANWASDGFLRFTELAAINNTAVAQAWLSGTFASWGDEGKDCANDPTFALSTHVGTTLDYLGKWTESGTPNARYLQLVLAQIPGTSNYTIDIPRWFYPAATTPPATTRWLTNLSPGNSLDTTRVTQVTAVANPFKWYETTQALS
jgi:hypothetical protein